VHFCIVVAAAAPAFAQVFKWVDDRGVTHYGERPPQGAKASEVQDKLASPPPARALARPAPKDQAPGSQPPPAAQPGAQAGTPSPAPAGAAPAAAAKAPPTPEEQRAEARKLQCAQERTALARLRGGTTSYTMDSKGERVTIDNSEAIAQQEKRVTEQCAG